MTDATATPTQWTTRGERQPVTPPVVTTAVVDGFTVSASDDGGWQFSVDIGTVHLIALGYADYLTPASPEKLAAAQAAAVASVAVIRAAGAVPA